MKKCRLCDELKTLDEFHKANGTRDGHRGECKECFRKQAKERYPKVREREIARAKKWREDNIERARANQRRARSTPEAKLKARADHLRRSHNLTLEQYEDMLAAQGGVCAICGREPNPNISLHVDHDHETGRIRRLLCFSCNNLLGDVSDDATLLEAAADYVRSFDPEIEEATRLAKARVRALIPA